MFASTRAAFTDVTGTVFSVALTALTEPIHRGSLANARSAIEARHREQAAATASFHSFDVGPTGGRADVDRTRVS